MDPQLAAKERAKRRNQMREDEVLGGQVDGFSGEVQYEVLLASKPFKSEIDAEKGDGKC